jgi:branched-chain amino acid transport system substrate-binding protein
MKRNFLKLLGVALCLSLVVILAVAGCAPSQQTPQPQAPTTPQQQLPAKDEIKIGWSRSLTGWGSTAGAIDEQEAVMLWVDEINAAGGIFVKEYGKKLPVKPIFYDDRSDIEQMVNNYEKLINNDKVDIIFPPTITPFNIATIPIAEKYHMVMLNATSGSSKPKELGAKYAWSITPIGSAWMDKENGLAGMVQANKDKISNGNVAVTYIADSFCIECHDAFVKYLGELGFNVVLDKDFDIETKDLSPLLLEVKSKNVDAYFSMTLPPGCFLQMQQMKEIGLNPKWTYILLGPALGVFQPMFQDNAEEMTGMGMYCGALNYPGSKEFYDNFIKKYGHAPNLLQGADGYHAAQMYQQAIERAGSLDNEKLREVLATQEFQTIEGPSRLRNGVNELAVPGIIQWQNGVAQTIWPPKMATAKFEWPKPNWK